MTRPNLSSWRCPCYIEIASLEKAFRKQLCAFEWADYTPFIDAAAPIAYNGGAQ
jgi:hypothetical protein